MKDPKDRDEKFYAYKYEELMEINGHYIYYEKNPEMQNYMISSRKETRLHPVNLLQIELRRIFVVS